MFVSSLLDASIKIIVRYLGQNSNYSATLYANGSVKLFVGYSFDSGFCQGSGPCLEKTIRPFKKDEIKKIEESQKRHIAEIEYEQRQAVIRELAIAEIINELFE